jgi:hypothetical protein
MSRADWFITAVVIVVFLLIIFFVPLVPTP